MNREINRRADVIGIFPNDAAITLALMLRLAVHSAGVQDRDGAALVLDRITRRFPFLERIFADAGYQGSRVAAIAPRPGRDHQAHRC